MTPTKTMKWTPGPWWPAVDTYGVLRVWARDDGDICDIASTEGDGSILLERREANARLVAKAPEMAELLREVHHFLSHTGNHRALVGDNFPKPSIRYETLKTLTERAEALLRELESA